MCHLFSTPSILSEKNLQFPMYSFNCCGFWFYCFILWEDKKCEFDMNSNGFVASPTHDDFFCLYFFLFSMSNICLKKCRLIAHFQSKQWNITNSIEMFESKKSQVRDLLISSNLSHVYFEKDRQFGLTRIWMAKFFVFWVIFFCIIYKYVEIFGKYFVSL